jgi:hypothetical protein
MRRMAVLTLTIALGTAAGCGPSAEQKQAEEAAKQTAKALEQAAKSTESGATQAAKGLEQMAKGFEAMAGNAAGGKMTTVAPVSFRDLQTLFPDLDGWEKAKPTGERMTAPFAFSQAEVRYKNGEARLDIKIVDSGYNQLLFTPFMMFMQAGYEKETSSGYEKSTTVGGQPGWEKWNTEGKDGEVNAFVGKRYILTVEGRNIEDIKVLHAIVGKIDLARLAAMK